MRYIFVHCAQESFGESYVGGLHADGARNLARDTTARRLTLIVAVER